MIDQRFGKLVVRSLKEKIINYVKGKPKGFQYIYECLCDCGTTSYVRKGNLKSGHTQSCGCIKKEFTRSFMNSLHNLSGQVFNRLTVLDRDPDTFDWNCMCSCGNETTASTDYLKGGKKGSCGCLRNDMSRERLGQYKKDYRKSLGKDENTLLTPETLVERMLFKETAKEVLYRDNYTCAWCSKNKGRLDVHHLEVWSKTPELRFEKSNLVTLCQQCHKDVHVDGYHKPVDPYMTILLQGYANVMEDGYPARIELTPN